MAGSAGQEAIRGSMREQVPACQHQIGHTKQRKQLRGILCKTAISNFAMMKEIFDNVEDMLDPGACAGLGLLKLFLQAAQFGFR